ncbi:MAG: tyrosine-protein phosphatase [Aristaeellaceae bacterium]
MITGFADIHAHFVYGMDDGAQTREDMEAMLDAAYADGITSLIATPHVTPGLRPFDSERYQRHLQQAQDYCIQQGYPITLYPGAELLYTPALAQYVVDHTLPSLAGTEQVLLEFSPSIALKELEGALDLLERRGYTPMLAHIERYACLLAGNTAEKVKANHDVLYQVNANTVLNERGFLTARKIRSWFRAGLVDHVASDAHNVRTRPFQLSKAYAALVSQYGEEEAARLTGLS